MSLKKSSKEYSQTWFTLIVEVKLQMPKMRPKIPYEKTQRVQIMLPRAYFDRVKSVKSPFRKRLIIWLESHRCPDIANGRKVGGLRSKKPTMSRKRHHRLWTAPPMMGTCVLKQLSKCMSFKCRMVISRNDDRNTAQSSGLIDDQRKLFKESSLRETKSRERRAIVFKICVSCGGVIRQPCNER